MIKITNRLKSLEKYIFPNDKIMDVGCDHALLDIYLIQSGLLKNICVCDVNPNALKNGKDNIEKYGLSDEITPVLSYGIEKIDEYDVNTLIISGMGSKNIIDILSSPNLDRIYKLILQSNNNHAELRNFLKEHFFTIVAEEIVEDNKKTYINIIAVRDVTKKEYSKKELEFGPILIKDKINLSYFKNLEKSYENIYYRSKNDEALDKLNDLREVIKELSE